MADKKKFSLIITSAVQWLWQRKTINLLIICTMVLVVGFFFWPTLYHYEKVTEGNWTFLIRTHRLTGFTEEYVDGRWIPENSQDDQNYKFDLKSAHPTALPLAAKQKISGKVISVYSADSVQLQVTNEAPDWTITGVSGRFVLRSRGAMDFFKHSESIVIAPGDSKIVKVAKPKYGMKTADSELGIDWKLLDAWGVQGKK